MSYLSVRPQLGHELFHKLRILIALPDIPRNLGNISQPPQSIPAKGAPRQKRMSIPLQIKQMQSKNTPEQPTDVRPKHTFALLFRHRTD